MKFYLRSILYSTVGAVFGWFAGVIVAAIRTGGQ